MSTYVIGDIQGCFLTFQKLLAAINFDDEHDRAILLGDVINRGPRSLETLRYVKKHQRSFAMVLGNHEIKALALYLKVLEPQTSHSLEALFAAPDREELFSWLRQRPLILTEQGSIFVHAGILPSVSIAEAERQAQLVAQKLQGGDAEQLLRNYYIKRTHGLAALDSNEDPSVTALSYLTLIRMCSSKNTMESYSGALQDAPAGLKPWFELREDEDCSIYFGHWAALGYFHYKNYCCLDSGCVWGNKLSALRLDDQCLFQVDYGE